MSGDSIPRLFVYGLTLVLCTWAVGLGWLATRRAWRRIRPYRSTEVGSADHDGPRVPA